MMIAYLSLLVMGVALFTRPAHAYFDPGTASMLLQGLVGAVAASAAVLSLYYQRLKVAFLKRFGKGEREAAD